MTIQTLHLCNLDEVANLEPYWLMVCPHDQIIFYAHSINKEQYKTLDKHLPLTKKHYQSKLENKAISNITMEKWLQLVNTSNKVITWK